MKRSSFVWAALLAAVAGWHILLRAHGRGIPLITDEGEYAQAARSWSQGGLPYRDAFSQKPPMIFLLYRVATFFSADPEAPRGAAALAALATLAALFLATPRGWSRAGRCAAPAAFAALAALPIGDYSFPANTEVLVNLFAGLAAVACLRAAPLFAGLAAGAALSAKQTALWSLLAFAAAAVLLSGARARGRALARYTLGACLVPALWAGYFAWRGGLGDYWQAAWAGNARYAAVLVMTDALSGQLAWFAATLLPRLLLFSAPALALAVAALRGLRAEAARPIETLAVLWFGGAVAGALTGLFLFPHYFLTLAPPLALAAACGVERLASQRRAWAALALACWPALLTPRLFFLAGPRERALTLLFPNPLFETRALGREIGRRAAPLDRLHVFGSEGALFAYSGLRPATRHTLSYALTLFPKNAAAVEEELSALRNDPPRFVVWSTQPLSTMISSSLGERYRLGLQDLMAKNYSYEGTVRVTAEPATPEFRPSAPNERPLYESEDRLLLFERRHVLPALPRRRG